MNSKLDELRKLVRKEILSAIREGLDDDPSVKAAQAKEDEVDKKYANSDEERARAAKATADAKLAAAAKAKKTQP